MRRCPQLTRLLVSNSSRIKQQHSSIGSIFTPTVRNFSAEDLFDQMESPVSLVDICKNRSNKKKAQQESSPYKVAEEQMMAQQQQQQEEPCSTLTVDDTDEQIPQTSSSSISLFNSLSQSELEFIHHHQETVRSRFLSDKIEQMTSVAAEIRERGLSDKRLEDKFGPGASRDWLEMNEKYLIEKENSSSHSIASLSTKDPFVQLVTSPHSLKDAVKLVQQKVNELKNSSSSSYSVADLDLLFSTAMQSVLAFSRSPTEARHALEFVKLFSLEQQELLEENINNKGKSNKMMSSDEEKKTPLVWMTAVETAALALATPELFSRLLNEALTQLTSDESSRSVIDMLSDDQLCTFYTSALSWSSSQFDVESSLKVWSHFLSMNARRNGSPLMQDALLRNAALVIRSTNEIVEASIESSSNSGNDNNNNSVLSKFSSSISGAASKYDGGIRNSMFKLLTSNRDILLDEEILFNELSWENFEAVLSCFDSDTQVKMMKMRMIKKNHKQQKDESKSENSSSSQSSSETIKNTVQLFELLKRLVAAADVTGAEDVSQVILSTLAVTTGGNTSSTIMREFQEETVLLMMRLYCQVLSPSDFGSALHLFTKYCRGGDEQLQNENSEENTTIISSLFSATSQHYSILLAAAPSPDDASALFLDACAAGVVLDSNAYANLFKKEARSPPVHVLRDNIVAELQRSGRFSNDDGYSNNNNKIADSNDYRMLPPLPAGADAHALRLKELERNDDDMGQNQRVVIPLS